MPATSLFHMATQASIHYVRRIDDVGDTPYSLLRPMLLKVENPNQLREIEKNSPQICGADAELWRSFIRRDVPKWQDKVTEPKNPQHWYKVYRKLRRDAEAELQAQGAALKAALNSQSAERQGQQMHFIDKVVAPPSKHKPRGATTASRTGNSSLLTFNRGTRTKMASGKDVLERARREAREASLRGRGALTTPTHLLHLRAGQIRSVPKSLAVTPAAAAAPTSRAASTTTSSSARPLAGAASSTDGPKRIYSAPRLASNAIPQRRDGTGVSAATQRVPAAGQPKPPPQLAGRKRPAADFLMAPKRR